MGKKHAPTEVRTTWREYGIVAAIVAATLVVNLLLGLSTNALAARLASLFGLLFILSLALLMSRNMRLVNRKTVAIGLLVQFLLALALLCTPAKRPLFDAVDYVFTGIKDFSLSGAYFVFGWLEGENVGAGAKTGVTIAAVIIFIGALTRMLYHLGLMQLVVRGMAYVMRRLMGASGAESLGTASNVFIGMVESALTVRPYVAGMTRSELFTLMTAGMATVAGSVMAAYIEFVKPFLHRDAGGHLMAASLISAPAAIVIAKIMIPETEQPATSGVSALPALDEGEEAPVNLFDAAVKGALDGLKLAITVLGLLIAFLALVAALDAFIGLVTFGHLTFSSLVGYVCAPIAIGMGIPIGEAVQAGSLIGQKTVANEWIAYLSLGKIMSAAEPGLSARTAMIMSYALCGFANFGSLGIMIAGIGGIAPTQRQNLAKLGLLSIVSGSLAAFMTACIAGLLGSAPMAPVP